MEHGFPLTAVGSDPAQRAMSPSWIHVQAGAPVHATQGLAAGLLVAIAVELERMPGHQRLALMHEPGEARSGAFENPLVDVPGTLGQSVAQSCVPHIEAVGAGVLLGVLS